MTQLSTARFNSGWLSSGGMSMREKEQGITAEPRDPIKSHHTSQGTLAIKTFDFDRTASRSVGCGSLI